MQHPVFANWKILLIILLEGFVTISLEILAIRQLIPFVGNSVIITGLIIGIFLLCLAYGYQAGGRQRENLSFILRRNFWIAGIGIGLGLSYVFIDCFFGFVQGVLHLPLVGTLVLYLCLIIAPIVYFLGQTVPITMHLLDAHDSAGRLGGKVLHLSTLGSFLGSILTAVVLMSFVGVAWTVIVNVLMLMFLILMLSERKHALFHLALLTVLLIFTYCVNRGFEAVLFVKTTPYANYSVLPDTLSPESDERGTLLSINGSSSSFLDQNKQGFAYIEFIKTVLFQQLKLQNKQILVLGAGGFTLSAENTYGNSFTYVDIDPAIYPVVKQNFLKTINGAFVAADARQYVKAHPDTYDVIVSDPYSNPAVIPSQLLTLDYFKSLKAALKPEGIAVFNVIAPPLLNTAYGERVDNTLRAAFGHCTVNALNYTETGRANLIYICQNNPDADTQTIYTDDLNRASIDMFSNK